MLITIFTSLPYLYSIEFYQLMDINLEPEKLIDILVCSINKMFVVIFGEEGLNRVRKR